MHRILAKIRLYFNSEYRERILMHKRLIFGRERTPDTSILTPLLPFEPKVAFDKKIANTISEFYIAHRFDLLGSGWVRVGYNDKCLGVEGHIYDMNVTIETFDGEGNWLSNILRKNDLKQSQQIWQLINDHSYLPIDWQKDFKSGYRWSNKTYFKKCRENVVGVLPGVDIKVPWELSRMQHLLQLAAFTVAFPSNTTRNLKEFRNQILDFIATNPPQMGVCWSCTMDVAIRAANMLMAYSILKEIDEQHVLDPPFESVFTHSLYEHGRHIFNNLEWHYQLTSNHYLANIAGLLFISSFIENNFEVNSWLAFSTNELIKEFSKQFYLDGATCEASTSYHRLSGEIMLYSSALLLGMPLRKAVILKRFYKYNDKLPMHLRSRIRYFDITDGRIILPEWYLTKLLRIVRFTDDCTIHNGNIVQIGDNDSGRFFRLTPMGFFITNSEAEQTYLNLKGYNMLIDSYKTLNEQYWDENHLNHTPLLYAADELFKDIRFTNSESMEAALIKRLTQLRKFNPQKESSRDFKIDKTLDPDLRYVSRLTIPIPDKFQEYTQNRLKLCQYPDFGLIIVKSDGFFMSIMMGHTAKKYCNWGHSHNDRLSVTLVIGNQTVFTDPGSYLYTSLPNRRMEFVSNAAHGICTINNSEQAIYTGIFTVEPDFSSVVEKIGVKNLTVSATYNGITHRRKIKVSKRVVYITDYASHPITTPIHDMPYFSNGYGKLIEKYPKTLPDRRKKGIFEMFNFVRVARIEEYGNDIETDILYDSTTE